MSLILVIAMSFLFMLSLVVAAGIGILGRFLDQYTMLSSFVVDAINIGLSFVFITAVFAIIYKMMPHRQLYWRDVLVGAAGTALLFEAGQSLIGLYLTRFLVANIYGAAAGVIVLLVWTYYSAQVFLLGAEFTKVWARHYGSQQNFLERVGDPVPRHWAGSWPPACGRARHHCLPCRAKADRRDRGACASPDFAAIRYHFRAATGFCRTPSPRSYRTARSNCEST